MCPLLVITPSAVISAAWSLSPPMNNPAVTFPFSFLSFQMLRAKRRAWSVASAFIG